MEERNLRKTRVGVVVSDKMDKTIVVAGAAASDQFIGIGRFKEEKVILW